MVSYEASGRRLDEVQYTAKGQVVAWGLVLHDAGHRVVKEPARVQSLVNDSPYSLLLVNMTRIQIC